MVGFMSGVARGRRPLPDASERLAALDEELTLTTAFAALMIERGQLGSAAAVVDEQRRRLDEAGLFLLRTLGLRRRRHLRATLAGLSAALALSVASIAAVIARLPAPSSGAAIVRQASARMEKAAAAGTDVEKITAIVRSVDEQMLELTPEELRDPSMKTEVAGLVGVAEHILQTLRGAPSSLFDEVQRVAARVGVRVSSKDPAHTPMPSREPDTPEHAKPASTPAEQPTPNAETPAP